MIYTETDRIEALEAEVERPEAAIAEKEQQIEALLSERDGYIKAHRETEAIQGRQIAALTESREKAEEKVKELEGENEILKTHCATSDFCSAEWKADLEKLKLQNLKDAVLGDAEKIKLTAELARLREAMTEIRRMGCNPMQDWQTCGQEAVKKAKSALAEGVTPC